MATVKYFDTSDLTNNCDYQATGSNFTNPTGTGDLTVAVANIDYERYEVCDTVTAIITGNVVPNFTTPNLSVNVAGVTIANDTIVSYSVRWGFKSDDTPLIPIDIVNSGIVAGQYQLEVYATLRSGNRLLIATCDYTWNGTTVTGLSTQAVNRSYEVSVARVLANWENGAFTTITNVDGSAYTVIGTITKDCPQLVDEIINSDEKMGGASVILRSGTLSIANGTHSTLLGPDGTAWTNPGNLKSVTILARKSNTSDAIVGSGANQVMVVTTDNTYILLEGESVTYSVEDGNIQDFVSVECLVNSAALVVYNRS